MTGSMHETMKLKHRGIGCRWHQCPRGRRIRQAEREYDERIVNEERIRLGHTETNKTSIDTFMEMQKRVAEAKKEEKRVIGMAGSNKRNRRHEQKAMRRSKEIARHRDALEKKEEQDKLLKEDTIIKGKLFRDSVAETALVGAGKIKVSKDNESITFTDETGISVEHDIDHIEIVRQDSEDWKTYVETGGNPSIPAGSVAVKIVTNWKDASPSFRPVKRILTTMTKNSAESFIKVFKHKHRYNRKTGYNLGDLSDGVYDNLNGSQKHEHSSDDILSEIIDSLHPATRQVQYHETAIESMEKASLILKDEGLTDDLREQVRARIYQAASLDPMGEILIKEVGEIEDSLSPAVDYYGLTSTDISPGIDNKELNLAYDLVSDETTRRIKFDQLNYPVWEGHTTHPTRDEGFITKPPFPRMYIQFNDFVALPSLESDYFLVGSELYTPQWEVNDATKESGRVTKEMTVSVGAIAFSDAAQHILVRRNRKTSTTRAILPQVGKEWAITPPRGTTSAYDGYSSVSNDSIMLGYLHWWGILAASDRGAISRISQGAYFDINTGAIWVPLSKVTGGETSEIIPASDVFEINMNGMSTHLIPAGSGIESSVLTEGWNQGRRLNLFEDTAMKIGDIFMYMMNYMTSPRMQTEEIQAPRAERRRAEKSGSPPPPPWTTIAYKPPSSTKQNSASTGTGSKHSYMYDVRGHWKKQPHGPRRSLRKLIWIDNHYSGLGNATYIPRNRLVDEKEEFEIAD